MHFPGEKLPKEYMPFKQVRLTVWMALECHPNVPAVYIPAQSNFIPASAWLLGCSGPQLPLQPCAVLRHQ